MANVSIKGRESGLEIVLSDGAPYPALREELLSRLKKNPSFFKGTNVRAVIRGKSLSPAQRKELIRVFSMDFGIADVLFGDEVDLQRKVERSIKAASRMHGMSAEEEEKDTEPELIMRFEKGSKSTFVMETVRNGQRIESMGDVVVIGDVNPGAEIIAGGSIAVFGKLRGLAHAGCSGDRDDACIAALSLSPKQLRLAGRIVSFSRDRGPHGPEIAKLDKDGKVVIQRLSGDRR